MGSNSFAYAERTSSLNSKKEKIQDKIDSAEEKIAELQEEKEETEEYITALQEKIELLQDKIDVLEASAKEIQSNINTVEAKITSIEEEMAETQARIDEKQEEFDQTYSDYCQRLRAMYISGTTSNLEVLLTCTDMSSVLTRAQMIKSVSQQDSETLDTLMTQMEEIEKDKASLEQQRTELSEKKTELESQKSDLQSSINEVSAAKSELESEGSECNALIKKLASEESEYQELIEESEEELAKVEAEIKAAYAKASTTSSGSSISGSTGSGAYSGTLGYPTSSRSISAGYPYYSSGKWHGGIDFTCSTGTPVCAAAAGTVILVKSLTYSYGKYIIIDHGNGLSTLYAHNSSLVVSVGDTVSKGQVIAYSGATGNATGPHCHFEVRVNGSQVNPLNYL